MNTSLSAFIDLYTFPTGRRIFALRQVAERAQAVGFTDLATHCAAALKHDQKCYALERRWSGVNAQSKAKAPAEGGLDAVTLDGMIDRTLTALRDNALNQAAGAIPGAAIHAKVTAFLKAIIPTGDVSDITNLPMVEEDVAVGTILGQLTGDLAKTAEELELKTLVARLADLHPKYHAALVAPTPEVLAFSDVRSARATGQDLLLEAVAIVVGRHHGKSEADVAGRNALLGPILEQDDAIGAAQRGRRVVVDVDPDTGNPDPTPPVGGPTDPAKPV